MARQVIWTGPAEKERDTILRYWINRNGSSAYSQKLLALFNAATRSIITNPYLGRPTDIEGIRVLSVGDYLLFYDVAADAIVVHHIWDGRRDLTKLKF